MNFRQSTPQEQPEINLIPLIDILLVILIFLLLSTSFSHINILRIQLPHSQAKIEKNDKPTIHINLSSTGKIEINRHQLNEKIDIAELTQILSHQVGTRARETLLVVHADAQATHQAVIRIMEAARAAGLARVSFATKSIAR